MLIGQVDDILLIGNVHQEVESTVRTLLRCVHGGWMGNNPKDIQWLVNLEKLLESIGMQNLGIWHT